MQVSRDNVDIKIQMWADASALDNLEKLVHRVGGDFEVVRHASDSYEPPYRVTLTFRGSIEESSRALSAIAEDADLTTALTAARRR